MTEFVTLRNILEATPLGEAELLAGAGGLDREVRETNIIEVPDACDWMRGGEILFSAGYAFGGDGAQGAKLIRALAKRGITALVLKPGKYMPAVPQEMIETAERLQFPLLQIPQDKPYSIYMEATFERLRDSRLYELRMITNLHSRLLNASIHGGKEAICKVLEERLNKPVALWDAKWRMIYGAERYPEWNGQMSGPDVRREASKEAMSSFYIVSTEGNEEGAQVHLGIQCGGQGLRESEQVVLRYAVSLLSLEALREEEREQQYMRLNGTLLDNLLQARKTDPEFLRRQLDVYRIHLDSRWLVFAFRGPEEPLPMWELWHLLRQRTGESDLAFLLTQKSKCLTGALFFDGGGQKRARELLEQLPIAGKFGISRMGRGFSDFAAAGEEAETALNVLCQVKLDRHVASLEELGIYYPLCAMQDQTAMKQLYEHTLRPVERYDQENHGALVETLERFFGCGCNLRMTAEQMFLHKNSVSYRLHKVEELVGRSMEDVQFRLELQLCLLYRHLL